MVIASIISGATEDLLMKITSTAFENGDPIPGEYTCDGADVSPPLAFSEVPPEARSLALIMDDPDAPSGLWVHWLVWNIPSQTAVIARGQKIPWTQGSTSWKRQLYGGPCPPSGTHRYFFKLYALDSMLNLPAGKTKHEIEKAMKGHILAKGELVGTYKRK
jgi:Raf kinase inhibitor-like YbhB/YbcL family protein